MALVWATLYGRCSSARAGRRRWVSRFLPHFLLDLPMHPPIWHFTALPYIWDSVSGVSCPSAGGLLNSWSSASASAILDGVSKGLVTGYCSAAAAVVLLLHVVNSPWLAPH
jgi:hypothetical protein